MAKLLDEYLDLVKDYNWAPIWTKWSFIACVSAVLERRCFLDEHGFGYLYPNLYVLIVGPAGTGKSSGADNIVNNFIRTLENGPILASTHQTPATLIDELEAANKAQPGAHLSSPLFAYASEFDAWFKDIGGGELVDILLNFWDTRLPGVEWVKNTKMWKRQALKNPALTILGCTTPQALIQKKLAQTGAIGFISRMIVVCEPYGDYGTDEIVKLDNKKIISIQREFIRMNKLSGEFKMGPGSEAARKEIMGRCRKQLQEYSGDLMRTYMSRKAVQIRKVAMILSAMRNSLKIVLPEDLYEAENLISELEPTIKDAFGMQIEYRDSALASKILGHFKQRGIVLSERQLFARFMKEGEALSHGPEYDNVMRGLLTGNKLARMVEDGKILYKAI